MRAAKITRWVLWHRLPCPEWQGRACIALVGYDRRDSPRQTYWVAQAGGPAHEIHAAQARTLARALGGTVTETHV